MGNMKEKIFEMINNHKYVLGIAFRNSKLYFFIFFLLILITNIKELVLIIAPKYIFDCLQFGNSFQILVLTIIIYVGLYLGLHFMIYWLDYVKSLLEAKIKMRLNIELGEKFMKVDYDFLESFEAIERFQRAQIAISGGLSDLQMAGLRGEQGIAGYFEQLAKMIKDIFLLGSVLFVFSYVEASIGGFVIVCSAISVIFSMIQLKANVAVRKEAAPYQAKSRYCKKLLRNFEFGKEFRVFSLADFYVSKFEACTMEFLKVRDYYQRRCWFASAMSYVVNNVMRLLVIIALILKLKSGEITVGDFTMIFAAVLTFADTAQDLFKSLLSLHIFSAFMSDYRNCMSLKSKEKTLNSETLERIETIEFRDVWYSYPNGTNDTFALRGINVVLHPKEKISIVGFNGAGKTTFIKLLLGLYQPTKGEILINGKNRNAYSESDIRKQMSAVFQDFRIYAGTIEENITFGKEKESEFVEECMERAGIKKKVDSLKKKKKAVIGGFFEEEDLLLSGGESQKIAMARSFFSQASFLALDEPTSALDVVAEDMMYKNVMQEAKEECILFISHRLASSRFCNRILVFGNGEIIQEGTHEELLKQGGAYSQMWRVQAEKFHGG